MPTLADRDAKPAGPESPRPNACTERIILSRLLTGTSHSPDLPGYCFAGNSMPATPACYPRLNLQVRCQFKVNRFISTGSVPDYGLRVTGGDQRSAWQ